MIELRTGNLPPGSKIRALRHPGEAPGGAALARPVPVLFVHFGDSDIRGSEQQLLDLLGALDRSRYHPVLWCNGEALAEAARALDVTTHRTPLAFFFSASSSAFQWRTWWEQLRVARALVAQHGIRLLHANSGAPVQWLMPVARSLRLPVLAHLHAPYLRRDRLVLLLHQAALAVGVSRATTEGLLADGMTSARVRLIPNGIDPARLRPLRPGALRAELGIPAEDLVIGSVGSLITRKGPDVLLAAFARLAHPSAWLILAGSGPERERLEAMTDALGVAPRVRFVGNVEEPGVVYDAMDIHVLASRSEAFGLVLVEAALSGVPNIGSAVGGIPEVIDDERTGLLVPPDDAEALAGALGRLARDPGLRARLAVAGHEDAEARFTVSRMARDLSAAYDELLAIPPAQLGWGAAIRQDGGTYLRALPQFARRA
ncbi:MAG TPA: glycosyltransferase family 4 protein [Roseomonas sp.]